MQKTNLQTIYRFPFKGFCGHTLSQTTLTKGVGIKDDRRYAITNGADYNGEWMRSKYFFVNSRCDGMYTFALNYNETLITLRNANGMEVSFKPGDEESLNSANQSVAELMKSVGVVEDLPPPQIVENPRSNGAIWDYTDTPISIINTESVKAIGKKLNAELDPARFRGNLIIDGLPAWEEFAWMGKRIQIGETILDVHRPIDRCPTPGVNPQTSERDVEVTPGIQEHFGHVYCGMYANVVQGGEIKPGDEITVLADGEIALEDTFVSNASAYALWPRMVEVSTCEIGDTSTKISLKSLGPWALPDAKVGQKLRLHLGDMGWTTEYISQTGDGEFTVLIEDSQTDDPITEYLRKGFELGQNLVISGPYGRV